MEGHVPQLRAYRHTFGLLFLTMAPALMPHYAVLTISPSTGPLPDEKCCSSCKSVQPLGAFQDPGGGKTLATCKTCLEKRRAKKLHKKRSCGQGAKTCSSCNHDRDLSAFSEASGTTCTECIAKRAKRALAPPPAGMKMCSTGKFCPVDAQFNFSPDSAKTCHECLTASAGRRKSVPRIAEQDGIEISIEDLDMSLFEAPPPQVADTVSGATQP
jgi:hypothetical protein